MSTSSGTRTLPTSALSDWLPLRTRQQRGCSAPIFASRCLSYAGAAAGNCGGGGGRRYVDGTCHLIAAPVLDGRTCPKPTGRVRAADDHPVRSELLREVDIDPDATFFDLGGHSLLALSRVCRVEALCGRRRSLLRVGQTRLRGFALDRARDEPALDPAATPRRAALGWLRRLFGRTA
jgi:hypothetical protein